MNIIEVSYSEQLREHWTRSKTARRERNSQDRDLAKRKF